MDHFYLDFLNLVLKFLQFCNLFDLCKRFVNTNGVHVSAEIRREDLHLNYHFPDLSGKHQLVILLCGSRMGFYWYFTLFWEVKQSIASEGEIIKSLSLQFSFIILWGHIECLEP